jgi:WD40 repeat protein
MQRTAAALLMLAVLLAAAATMAGMDDVRPVLRIEAGMDTGTIWRIATDRSGRWAATASDDKTARVWELPSGKLRMVLRPPIWEGNGGKLFAVAMSPDATLVAVSGWTSADAPEQAVYLFDRGSGRMVRKLGPAPNVVKHLAFSPDGQWLAAALGAGQGIAVWSLQGEKLALRSASYGADSQQVVWSADGRLASSCYDGAIRLYQLDGRQLKELRSVRAPGGQRPLGLAFAPNGKSLAVA